MYTSATARLLFSLYITWSLAVSCCLSLSLALSLSLSLSACLIPSLLYLSVFVFSLLWSLGVLCVCVGGFLGGLPLEIGGGGRCCYGNEEFFLVFCRCHGNFRHLISPKRDRGESSSHSRSQHAPTHTHAHAPTHRHTHRQKAS